MCVKKIVPHQPKASPNVTVYKIYHIVPKFGGNTMGGPPQTRKPKFKLFNCLS